MRSAISCLLLIAAPLSLACSAAKPATNSGPAPAPATQPRTVPSPVVAPAAVRETLTVTDPELVRRVARLELQLLEKEAQAEDLQTRLDEMRGEFVRTLAKFQTATSRAEAASGMAEAEVALQSLKSAAGMQQSAAAAQVTRLVQEGSAEFNQQNYGGALYLATQAKALAATYRARPAEGRAGASRPGEAAFALPLRLKATGRANVRDGPGTQFALAFSVDAGSALTGQSYVDEWIRVSDDTGRTGWIFRNLVVKR